MYGKAIITPIGTDTSIKGSQRDFEQYVSLNYKYIDSVLEGSGRYHIKEIRSVMSHFNNVHAGVEILSMSKRIMNKVFDCVSYCNVQVYHQDTDSIHPDCDGVDATVKTYNDKYGQYLVGQFLGNFHVDFSMDGAVSEIYGNESYSLVKKTYLDMLDSANTDNNIINDEHIRMRGIPTACIKYYAKQKRITVLYVYMKL